MPNSGRHDEPEREISRKNSLTTMPRTRFASCVHSVNQIATARDKQAHARTPRLRKIYDATQDAALEEYVAHVEERHDQDLNRAYIT